MCSRGTEAQLPKWFWGNTASLGSSFFLPGGRTGALRGGFTEESSALHLTDLSSTCCLVYLLKEFSKCLNSFLSCRGTKQKHTFLGEISKNEKEQSSSHFP